MKTKKLFLTISAIFGIVAITNGQIVSSCFADTLIEYIPGCPLVDPNPEGALGANDATPSNMMNEVFLGEGGYLKLGFTDNILTNSGNSSVDLIVFEVAGAFEQTNIELRPTNPYTELQLQLNGVPDTDADGYYEFGSTPGGTSGLDIDAIVPGFAAGVLQFDAVKVVDVVGGNCSGNTPGADIDAVCAASSIPLDCDAILNLDLGPDIGLCGGQTFVIDAGVQATSYNWSTGEMTKSINVNSAGVYAVTVTVGGIEDLINNGDFSLVANSWADCGNLVEAYAGETTYGGSNSANTNVAEVDSGSDGIPGTPDDMALCQNVSGLTIGETYDLCFLYSRRNIGPNPMNIYINIDGGTLSDTLTASNSVFGFTQICYTFTATQTTHLLSFTPGYLLNSGAGMILDDISILTASNICSVADTVAVVYLSLDLGIDSTLCDDDSYVLDATMDNASYSWQDNSNNPTFTISQAGTYWVEVDSMGYSCRDSVSFSYLSTPTVDLGKDSTFCAALPILDATSLNASYLWQDGSTNSTFEVTVAGVYSVQVSNICGSAIATREVDREGCDCAIVTPTAFTPNGDGLNDQFSIFSDCELAIQHLTVFNRWGQKVFETFDPQQKWDGNFQNNKLPADIYLFVIEYKGIKQLESETMRGHITLFR